MTRISSFSLYQCPDCRQIHIKPEYGSISIYVPTDLFIDDEDLKACKKCGKSFKFKDYIYIGMQPREETTTPSKIELFFRKVINNPYVEKDVRKIYPSIS